MPIVLVLLLVIVIDLCAARSITSRSTSTITKQAENAEVLEWREFLRHIELSAKRVPRFLE